MAIRAIDLNDRETLESYPFKNKPQAIRQLDQLTFTRGEVLKIHYENLLGLDDYLVAIGVDNGPGPDCYSILSDRKISIFNGIKEDKVDISSVATGSTFIFWDPIKKAYGKVYSKDGKKVEEILTKNFYFLNLEDDMYYYHSADKKKVIPIPGNGSSEDCNWDNLEGKPELFDNLQFDRETETLIIYGNRYPLRKPTKPRIYIEDITLEVFPSLEATEIRDVSKKVTIVGDNIKYRMYYTDPEGHVMGEVKWKEYDEQPIILNIPGYYEFEAISYLGDQESSISNEKTYIREGIVYELVYGDISSAKLIYANDSFIDGMIPNTGLTGLKPKFTVKRSIIEKVTYGDDKITDKEVIPVFVSYSLDKEIEGVSINSESGELRVLEYTGALDRTFTVKVKGELEDGTIATSSCILTQQSTGEGELIGKTFTYSSLGTSESGMSSVTIEGSSLPLEIRDLSEKKDWCTVNLNSTSHILTIKVDKIPETEIGETEESKIVIGVIDGEAHATYIIKRNKAIVKERSQWTLEIDNPNQNIPYSASNITYNLVTDSDQHDGYNLRVTKAFRTETYDNGHEETISGLGKIKWSVLNDGIMSITGKELSIKPYLKGTELTRNLTVTAYLEAESSTVVRKLVYFYITQEVNPWIDYKFNTSLPILSEKTNVEIEIYPYNLTETLDILNRDSLPYDINPNYNQETKIITVEVESNPTELEREFVFSFGTEDINVPIKFSQRGYSLPIYFGVFFTNSRPTNENIKEISVTSFTNWLNYDKTQNNGNDWYVGKTDLDIASTTKMYLPMFEETSLIASSLTTSKYTKYIVTEPISVFGDVYNIVNILVLIPESTIVTDNETNTESKVDDRLCMYKFNDDIEYLPDEYFAYCGNELVNIKGKNYRLFVKSDDYIEDDGYNFTIIFGNKNN